MKKLSKLSIAIIMVTLLTMMFSMTVFADSTAAVNDPSGTKIGTSADITAAKPGKPTTKEIADQVGKNKLGINFIWVILTGCLIFFSQMVFMNTTCTIPAGAMAERIKYSAVVLSSFFISMIYYPLYGDWMWGGGWFSQIGKTLGLGHGALDFAGSSVVHAMGGLIALSGAIVIGTRIGKFRKDGKANVIPGHHIPMAVM